MNASIKAQKADGKSFVCKISNLLCLSFIKLTFKDQCVDRVYSDEVVHYGQRIHMKDQILFSLIKNNENIFKTVDYSSRDWRLNSLTTSDENS